MTWNEFKLYSSLFIITLFLVFGLNMIFSIGIAIEKVAYISVTFSTTLYSILAVIYKYSYYNQCNPIFDKYANIKNNFTRVAVMLTMVALSIIITKNIFHL